MGDHYLHSLKSKESLKFHRSLLISVEGTQQISESLFETENTEIKNIMFEKLNDTTYSIVGRNFNCFQIG